MATQPSPTAAAKPAASPATTQPAAQAAASAPAPAAAGNGAAAGTAGAAAPATGSRRGRPPGSGNGESNRPNAADRRSAAMDNAAEMARRAGSRLRLTGEDKRHAVRVAVSFVQTLRTLAAAKPVTSEEIDRALAGFIGGTGMRQSEDEMGNPTVDFADGAQASGAQ